MGGRISALRCASVGAAVAAALVAPAPAFAQEASYAFDIPAQDLASALRDYGRQSNQQIVFDSEDVAGKQSAPLIGAFTADAGLRILLSGSGMDIRRTPSEVLVVQSPRSPAETRASDASGGAIDSAEIIVTAQKREQSIQDIGISVTALGENALNGLGHQDIREIASQVPSLQVTQYSPTSTIFNLRGVSQNDVSDAQEAPIAFYNDEVYVGSLAAIIRSNFRSTAYRGFERAAGYSIWPQCDWRADTSYHQSADARVRSLCVRHCRRLESDRHRRSRQWARWRTCAR